MNYNAMTSEAVELLEKLISTPSVSRDESSAADELMRFLLDRSEGDNGSYEVKRKGNNVWCVPKDFDESLPTILLNAHIDTVKPVAGWTHDPFKPTYDGDRLYGLGSNDCGGGLVSLMQVFLYEQKKRERQAYNLI